MRAACIALVAFCVALPLPLTASDPGTALEAMVLAKDSAPGLVRAGKGIAAIPWHAAQCLRLPLGLAEMILAPLPGMRFADGLENTGKGLVAPLKLCIATLEMPVAALDGLASALGGSGK